jgi:hypothetical protein
VAQIRVYHMFRPDGAIFRYIGVLQSLVSLSDTPPTLASVYIHELSFNILDIQQATHFATQGIQRPYIQRTHNV